MANETVAESRATITEDTPDGTVKENAGSADTGTRTEDGGSHEDAVFREPSDTDASPQDAGPNADAASTTLDRPPRQMMRVQQTGASRRTRVLGKILANVTLEYRSFVLADGAINVGRITGAYMNSWRKLWKEEAGPNRGNASRQPQGRRAPTFIVRASYPRNDRWWYGQLAISNRG